MVLKRRARRSSGPLGRSLFFVGVIFIVGLPLTIAIVFLFFEVIEISKRVSESKFGVFASMRATPTKRLAFRVRRLLCALLSWSVVRRFDARNVCGYTALACALAQVIILLFVASLVFPMAAAASLLEIYNENQHTTKCDFF